MLFTLAARFYMFKNIHFFHYIWWKLNIIKNLKGMFAIDHNVFEHSCDTFECNVCFLLRREASSLVEIQYYA